MIENSLLLELPVPFKRSASGLMVEAQALNGLRRWSDNFSSVTVCAPLLPESEDVDSSIIWKNPADLLAARNVQLVELPWGYHPRDHFIYVAAVKKKFEDLIPTHRYLCFSNIGGIGAWGNIAAKAAVLQQRRYAVWCDSVIYEMPWRSGISITKTVKEYLLHWVTRHGTIKAIRRSSLGLFHGKTVYDRLSPFASAPALVHDVHVTAEDAISDDALQTKLKSAQERKDLRIGYVGRLIAIKGPIDWISAISGADRGGSQVQATWLGDGTMLAEAQRSVFQQKMQDHIKFPGFIEDREKVLDFLREIDVLVFCHLTPESPRCLIESLISGTPIVGYVSSYASELVGNRGERTRTHSRCGCAHPTNPKTRQRSQCPM